MTWDGLPPRLGAPAEIRPQYDERCRYCRGQLRPGDHAHTTRMHEEAIEDADAIDAEIRFDEAARYRDPIR